MERKLFEEGDLIKHVRDLYDDYTVLEVQNRPNGETIYVIECNATGEKTTLPASPILTRGWQKIG